MSRDATVWMPIYIGDWYTETSTFDIIERGAYIALLVHLWKEGGQIRKCEKTIAKVVGLTVKKWKVIEPTVLSKFEHDDFKLSHNVILNELDRARKNKEQKRAAGIASSQARKATGVERTLNGRATHAGSGEGEGSLSSVLDTGITLASTDKPFRVVEGGGK